MRLHPTRLWGMILESGFETHDEIETGTVGLVTTAYTIGDPMTKFLLARTNRSGTDLHVDVMPFEQL